MGVKILTTDNLPVIKEKAKKAIQADINDNFTSLSKEDPQHTNIPIQTVSFEAGDLSPLFVSNELQAMNDTEVYKAFVSVGDPSKSNSDPLVYNYKEGPRTKTKDFTNTTYWPANSNIQFFRNKKDVTVKLYFHNTFGTRGEPGGSPPGVADNAASYIGITGKSDKIHNYMKFDPATGTLTVRTTGLQ